MQIGTKVIDKLGRTGVTIDVPSKHDAGPFPKRECVTVLMDCAEVLPNGIQVRPQRVYRTGVLEVVQ